MTAAGGGFMSIGTAIGQFADAAAAGGFAVNETGGQALLKAIRDMMLWVDDNLDSLGALDRQLPLGSSNAANEMKPYMQNVVSDQQGFLTQLREFRASLTSAEQGIISAMGNYNNIDQGVEGNVRVV
jgi:hypothetical protein